MNQYKLQEGNTDSYDEFFKVEVLENAQPAYSTYLTLYFTSTSSSDEFIDTPYTFSLRKVFKTKKIGPQLIISNKYAAIALDNKMRKRKFSIPKQYLGGTYFIGESGNIYQLLGVVDLPKNKFFERNYENKIEYYWGIYRKQKIKRKLFA